MLIVTEPKVKIYMEEKQRQIICGILRAKQQQLLNVVLPQGTSIFFLPTLCNLVEI